MSGCFLSDILQITLLFIPFFLRCAAVPLVAISLKPRSINSFATSLNSILSLLDTERNTVPLVGIVLFPPFIALRYAVPKVGP